ncbi:MAG: radical SAM protein, partial [Chloroflexi bacterium]|nr:radical SAM protein [Chloroflexota bacterium]
MSEVFVPTKFMSHTRTEDGDLILYCAMTGAIGTIPPDKAEMIRDALKRNARHIAPLDGIMEDIKRGGFLILEGTDELQILRERYHEMMQDESYLNLIILPTEECNFRCDYCYESFSRGKMRKEIREGIKKFIANQKHLKHLDISWFGGEPLLAPNIVIELSQYFHEYCLEHHIELSADMTTNGSLLVPDVFEQIIQYGVRMFQITLDGVREDHNKHRIAANGGGTFDTILSNLRYMKSTKHSFVVILRNNLDPESIEKLQEFVNLMKIEFGGDPRFLMFFRTIGRWGGPNDKSLTICERSVDKVIMQANRAAIGAGFRVFASTDLGPFHFVCYAAYPQSLVINPNGNIYKCTVELDKNERNIVGQIYPDGRMELDKDKLALWAESNGMKEGRKCNSCFFAPACFGA